MKILNTESDRAAITGPRYHPGTRTIYVPSVNVINSFFRLLSDLSVTTIAHGAAIGTDRHISYLAYLHKLAILEYPVNTALDGPWPCAGHNRNLRMLKESKCSTLIVFPDGGRGTLDCREQGIRLGLTVIEYKGGRFESI